MSKKLKVKTNAVFNGQPVGSTIELDEKTARKYEALKYCEVIGEVKSAKKESAPKKPAKSSSKKSE